MIHEEFLFLADLAVVSLLGFFDLRQAGIEVFLIIEGNAVDSLQHLVLGVILPVRTGIFQEFEILDFFDRLNVRTTAKVSKITLGVAGNNGRIIHVVDQIDLVFIILEHLQGFFPADFSADDALAVFGNLLHFLFDLRNVFVTDRIFA